MPPTPPYSDCYFENSKHDLGYIYLFINFPSLLLSLISWSTFPQLLSDQMCQDYEMLYNSALDNESLLTKTGCFFLKIHLCPEWINENIMRYILILHNIM